MSVAEYRAVCISLVLSRLIRARARDGVLVLTHIFISPRSFHKCNSRRVWEEEKIEKEEEAGVIGRRRRRRERGWRRRDHVFRRWRSIRVRSSLGRIRSRLPLRRTPRRVFGILKEKNPALSEKTKTIIKPPQIAREGTKKTVFANLMEICNAMHRPHEHVTQYMMAELGTTGTLDGSAKVDYQREIFAESI